VEEEGIGRPTPVLDVVAVDALLGHSVSSSFPYPTTSPCPRDEAVGLPRVAMALWSVAVRVRIITGQGRSRVGKCREPSCQ
jgi:hypothetical protein